MGLIDDIDRCVVSSCPGEPGSRCSLISGRSASGRGVVGLIQSATIIVLWPHRRGDVPAGRESPASWRSRSAPSCWPPASAGAQERDRRLLSRKEETMIVVSNFVLLSFVVPELGVHGQGADAWLDAGRGQAQTGGHWAVQAARAGLAAGPDLEPGSSTRMGLAGRRPPRYCMWLGHARVRVNQRVDPSVGSAGRVLWAPGARGGRGAVRPRGPRTPGRLELQPPVAGLRVVPRHARRTERAVRGAKSSVPTLLDRRSSSSLGDAPGACSVHRAIKGRAEL